MLISFISSVFSLPVIMLTFILTFSGSSGRSEPIDGVDPQLQPLLQKIQAEIKKYESEEEARRKSECKNGTLCGGQQEASRRRFLKHRANAQGEQPIVPKEADPQ